MSEQAWMPSFFGLQQTAIQVIVTAVCDNQLCEDSHPYYILVEKTYPLR